MTRIFTDWNPRSVDTIWNPRSVDTMLIWVHFIAVSMGLKCDKFDFWNRFLKLLSIIKSGVAICAEIQGANLLLTSNVSGNAADWELPGLSCQRRAGSLLAAQRWFAGRSVPSATHQRKPVLRFWPSPDFLVVFKGCSDRAVDCHFDDRAENGSLSPGILQSC